MPCMSELYQASLYGPIQFPVHQNNNAIQPFYTVASPMLVQRYILQQDREETPTYART